MPRAVDLVIDVGAGRTTCLLVDHEAQNGRVDIESARLLPIRDFSQPGKAHRGAIESTVAFARATFGDEARSRHSGRLNAFHWPSLVRVGPEASRLVGATSDGDGMTGVVSPSRFLRDDVVTSDSWRFAVGPSVRARRRQMVVGRMLSHTTGQGLLPAPGTDASPSVVRPQFSLSAMSSFYFAELVLQALSAINTPVQAGEGGISEGRRALSRIVLCLASDMSSEAHEQACRRAEAAIEMLWRSLDWQTPGAPYSFDVPVVSRGLDATLGAQLAYLYDEIMQRYGGDVTAYLEAVGRHRPAVGMRPSLRIGAVDIGATGTRLTIATYSIERDQPLRPTVLDLVRDPIGGDDLIAAIVRAAVAPALRQALAAGAVGDVDAFLDPFIEAATKPPHGHLDSLASRFAAHWLRPAAAALLALDVSDGPIPERDLAITFDQLLAGRDSLDWTTAQRFEDAARAAGAVGFSLGVATIATSTRVLADTIAATTRDMVETIGASALASDCDLVLLTGWPGRLATIMALLRERMLWRPDRIVDLAGHHWQGWYPLSEAERAACDGKDVGLIGAVLARAGGDGLAMAARSDDNSTAQHWDHHDWSRHEEMRRTGEARA